MRVIVRWRPENAGGRRTGPPVAGRYFATAMPGLVAHDSWTTREIIAKPQFSVRLDIETTGLDDVDADMQFLVPEMVSFPLTVGTRITLTEGARPVADVLVTSL